MPESTAHESLEDAADAYRWAQTELPVLLGRDLGSVLVAGSSAGGYLALATAAAAAASEKPEKLLLIYGMLDATIPRYTTPGTNIFGRAPTDTAPVLQEWPPMKDEDDRKQISAYTLLPADMATDPRFKLVSALHIDALFPDYITGTQGLSSAIATRGIKAIPSAHRQLFPLQFGNLDKMPPTMLLHGQNDSAVPVDCSKVAEKQLRSAGTVVFSEFPEDAEHGFDARAGNIDIESPNSDKVIAAESLRRAVRFLEGAIDP